ncbi:hypothetical protein GOC59_02460 [Sinorhizobium medicae]|nr:hypothetical protein [Sinorhizobium medicae]
MTTNITTQAPAATLAGYIDSPAAEGNLNSVDSCLDFCDDARGSIADWLKDRIAANSDTKDAEGLALDDLREVIENLEGAAHDARLFIANYFEQSGAVSKVRDAILVFDKSPTDANRLKLAEASAPLWCHRIEMDAATKAIMRRYAVNRLWRSNIHYGVVHAIATSYYSPALIEKEAA